MTASSINHRPAPFIAAAAAVVAIAAGSVALSASHGDSAPGPQPQVSASHAPRAHHYQPTTSGGRVMVGE
jgi:hypothetical protein